MKPIIPQFDPNKHVRASRVNLRSSPHLDEAWIRGEISRDPAILGLGDLQLLAYERKQPKAGRLDLLLRDPETKKRFEVELMLGTLDESHLIRAIEYWDNERKRYPQFDHCAVIVAEEIPPRLLRVVHVLSSSIPMVVLKLRMLHVVGHTTLDFIPVVEEIVPGEDEDREPATELETSRTDWESKASAESVALADDCLKILREFAPRLALKYNKYYIGLKDGVRASNFVIFRAKRTHLRVEAVVSDQPSWAQELEAAEIEVLPGEKERDRLIFRLTKHDLHSKRDLLRRLLKSSYDDWNAA